MFHEHKIYSSRISYSTVRELNESERSRGVNMGYNHNTILQTNFIQPILYILIVILCLHSSLA